MNGRGLDGYEHILNPSLVRINGGIRSGLSTCLILIPNHKKAPAFRSGLFVANNFYKIGNSE